MIRVSEPVIAKNAKKYVNECLDSGWVSSSGRFIEDFENSFAKYIGTRYAVSTTSGTTALHLGLAALGIGPGDEVIIPDLTIISCALAVIYTGAKPVLVDVDSDTGNMNPALIETKITKRTKAIMVVHLYGHPASLNAILKIAKKHRLKIIEDAAESLGSAYQTRKTGSIGDIGCFSFYANKLVTTGEGGMIVTNNKNIYEKAKSLKNLSHHPKKRFLHKEIGFNYRLTNLQAALGLAQLEEIDRFTKKKQLITKMYDLGFKNSKIVKPFSQTPSPGKVTWMYALIKTGNFSLDYITDYLKMKGIETRNFFTPLHSQPALKKYITPNLKYPVSDDLFKKGFYIPSGLNLNTKQINYIIDTLNSIE